MFSDLRTQFLNPGTRLDEYEGIVGLPGRDPNYGKLIGGRQDWYLCAEISVRRILHNAEQTRKRSPLQRRR
jgi:hypothetical protein